jgi:hypothetical protein
MYVYLTKLESLNSRRTAKKRSDRRSPKGFGRAPKGFVPPATTDEVAYTVWYCRLGKVA